MARAVAFLALTLPLFCLDGAVLADTTPPPSSAADACAKPPHTLLKLSSLDLEPLSGSDRFLVPVTVNGQPKKFLLGTAGGLSTLNQIAVDAMDLKVRGTDGRALDNSGHASNRYVRLTDLRIGNMQTSKADLMITPDRNAGRNPASDGILAAGLRYRYDVEMDFANLQLNYFSADHCPGDVTYWSGGQAGVVPIEIRRRQDNRVRKGELIQNPLLTMTGEDGVPTGSSWSDPFFYSGGGLEGADIQVKVMLDGREFRANIDTSLEYSSLNSMMARAFYDVRADTPGSAPASTLSAKDPPPRPGEPAVETVRVFGAHTFAHTFHTLSFGGVTVVNPHLLVGPDQTGDHDPLNIAMSGSHIFNVDDGVAPDISIGMDVLSKLHLYFAFQERKLYVTPAAPAAQASLTPP